MNALAGGVFETAAILIVSTVSSGAVTGVTISNAGNLISYKGADPYTPPSGTRLVQLPATAIVSDTGY